MDGLLDATAQAEERHFWFRGLRRSARALLEAALDGRPARRIIDCGAGTGRNLEWLAGLGPASGIELSPAGVRYARAHGRPVARGSVTHLPLANDSADVATSFDVLVCLDDAAERQAVREMWRVLAPGGIGLFNVAALPMLHGAHSILSGEHRRYSRGSLTDLLTGAGFLVERLTFTNMVTLPIVLALRLVDRLTGRAKTASAAELRVPPAPVNLSLDAALRLESALLPYASLPIGSSILCVARKPRVKRT